MTNGPVIEIAMNNEMKDILLVDDDAVLRTMLSELLEDHGYCVRTAPDGFVALTLIRYREPDILLSDLDMPRMSGFELLSIVRRRFPTIAVIAMSGMSMPPGIAADAFYAKGATSIFKLIGIFHSIADEGARRSQRVAAPVWVDGTAIHSGNRSMTAVTCGPFDMMAQERPSHSPFLAIPGRVTTRKNDDG